MPDHRLVTVPMRVNVAVSEAERLCKLLFQSLSDERQGIILNDLDIIHRAELDLIRGEEEELKNSKRQLLMEQI